MGIAGSQIDPRITEILGFESRIKNRYESLPEFWDMGKGSNIAWYIEETNTLWDEYIDSLRMALDAVAYGNHANIAGAYKKMFAAESRLYQLCGRMKLDDLQRLSSKASSVYEPNVRLRKLESGFVGAFKTDFSTTEEMRLTYDRMFVEADEIWMNLEAAAKKQKSDRWWSVSLVVIGMAVTAAITCTLKLLHVL